MLYLVRVDDVQAKACLELLAEAGVSAVRQRPLAPERTWPLTGLELGSLPQRLVLVGADPVLERRLRLSGREVTVLDERRLVLDGRLHANRSGPRLVELERLLGCRLFDGERRAEVLAFARGGIDALRQAGTVAAGIARTVDDDRRARAEAAGETLPPGGPKDRISRLPAMPKVLAVGRDPPEKDPRRLVLAMAPLDHRLVADSDLVLAGSLAPVPRERLWIFVDGDGRPLAVELVLPAARAAIGEQWLEELLRAVDAVTGIVDGAEPERFRLRVRPEGSAGLSRALDGLLDALAIGNRPLRAQRVSFVQPLRVQRGRDFADLFEAARQGRAGWKLVEPTDEERRYFLEHIGASVAPRREELCALQETGASDLDCLALFAASQPDLRLEVSWPGTYGSPLAIELKELRIAFAYNRVLLVEWTVAFEEPDGPDTLLWRWLARRREVPEWSFGGLLDWVAKARFVYSGFVTEEAPGMRVRVRLLDGADSPLGELELGREVSPGRITGWFAELLRRIFGELLGAERTGEILEAAGREGDRTRLVLLSDDRARVFASVVPYGDAPQLSAAEDEWRALLARLRMVDPWDTGFFYAHDFALRELGRGSYARFAPFTTYLVTDHAFACVTFGGFGQAVIHGNHMRTMYRRMALLGWAWRATLAAFRMDIEEALRQWRPDDPLPAAYRELRPRFLRFQNVLWERRISSQVQGVELFDLMQKELGIEAAFEDVERDIRETDEYDRIERELEAGRRARALTALGVPGALVAFLWGLEAPLAELGRLLPAWVTGVATLGGVLEGVLPALFWSALAVAALAAAGIYQLPRPQRARAWPVRAWDSIARSRCATTVLFLVLAVVVFLLSLVGTGLPGRPSPG